MTTTAPRKKPADRLPKTAKPGVFTFEHGDRTYELPPPSAALEQIPGRVLRDAMLGGDEGELRFGFLCLEAVGVPQETLDAIYDKPAPEMMDVIGRWMRSGDLSGATLPES